MRDRQKSLSSKGLKQYWLTNPSQNTVHGAQSGTRQNCAFSVRTIHAPIPLSTPPEKSWWTEITTQRSPSYAIAARYGVREWYVCPHCVKRVAKLYIGKKDIGCRACWKLHYKSQSADKLDRMRMKIRQQRYAIWGNNDLTNNLFNDIRMFPKPKGMRWATFDRKRAELSAMEMAYWQAFSPVVDRITGVIESKAGKASRGIGLTL